MHQHTLAVSYAGANVPLLSSVLPLVGYLEVTPDAVAYLDDDRPHVRPDVLSELRDIGNDAKVILHGVGLSIGSADAWNSWYLGLLDEMFDSFEVAWHSEHLGYTTVDGQFLGTMLPIPRTEEALDMVCARVRTLQERYPADFLLEHVVGLLPDAPCDYSDAEFLNLLAARTGCGLVLDAYNLFCDRENRGLDLERFFDALDFEPVVELHVAGGTTFSGLTVDVHSRGVAPPTMAIAQTIAGRAPSLRAITFELMEEAIPLMGVAGITSELQRLTEHMALVVP